MKIELQPVGYVHSSRASPRDDHWDQESVHIQLAGVYGAEALEGLQDFSHVEILFLMDQVPPEKVETGARHPRNRTDWPRVGIFSQRGKNRPNRLGLTVCSIVKIDGTRLHVKGLDAIDKTPVLDIKPWVQEFAPRGELRQPGWISELMREYW